MALIGATAAQVLVSIVDIAYGIRVEKWYVSWTAVTLNAINFIIALAAITLPTDAFVLLAFYAGLGAVAARLHWKRVYVLFGSKTYGSLMFVLAVREFGYLDPVGMYAQSVYFWLGTPAGEIILSWVILAIIVHIVGHVYAKRKQEDMQEKSGL